jgi:hypothetical protein
VGLFEVGSGLALRKSSNSTVRKSDGRIDAIRAGWSLFAPAGRQCPVRHTAHTGGILSYLREIPPEQSLWRVRPAQERLPPVAVSLTGSRCAGGSITHSERRCRMQGDCYVFDRRAALNHSLQSCRQWCFNCRRALSPAGSSRRTVRSRALSVVCCVWLRALTVPAVHWSLGSVRDDVSAVRGGCFVRALLRFAHGGAAGQLPNSPTAVRDAAAEFPHGVWRASVLVSLQQGGVW